MGCQESTATASTGYKMQYDLKSPELKRVLMQKRFKRAGEIVQQGSIGSSYYTDANRALVLETDPVDGTCALHWAASVYGAFDVLSWLIEEERGFDFDINAQNYRGDTALHIAIHRNIPDAVTIIMRQVMNFNDQLPCNEDGHTPLHLAMALNRHQLLPSLVSEDGKWDKFNPDRVLDVWGRPAIFAGVEYDCVESVQLLTQKFKADGMIASRPNGRISPPQIEIENSCAGSPRFNNSYSVFGGSRKSSTGHSTTGGWMEEDVSTSSDPESGTNNSQPQSPKSQVVYAQLPTKKSMRRRPVGGSNPGDTASGQHSPGSHGLGSPVSNGSMTFSMSSRDNNQQQQQQQEPGKQPCVNGYDSPLVDLADSGDPSKSTFSKANRNSATFKPLEYPHKPSHGTSGDQWQTPLEYAEFIGAKKCIVYLSKLKEIKYRSRRSQQLNPDRKKGNHSAIMKLTSTGHLARRESVQFGSTTSFGGLVPKSHVLRRTSSAKKHGHSAQDDEDATDNLLFTFNPSSDGGGSAHESNNNSHGGSASHGQTCADDVQVFDADLESI